uniref:Very-long-chain 3-ketoacyl-CoA synthase, Thiolase-like protein n=1 Tax=Tanacetum cinerariifolium TaxID=118510 RepID=A0A6L2LIG2_TANCI|nr:very-long-chain 3-ketoacyl-CoA synthase, Thiolase-like protein [Tanacetum cinerariifolium]
MFKYAKESYYYLSNNVQKLLLVTLVFAISIQAFKESPNQFSLIQKLVFTFLIISVPTFYFLNKPRTVYLLDFACFKPSFTLRVPTAMGLEHGHIILASRPESFTFIRKILERSGLGEETCVPQKLHYLPPNPNMMDVMDEAHLVIFSAMDSLFQQTGISPKEIDILIVNCSVFAPTPSITTMVVNKYKMNHNGFLSSLSNFLSKKLKRNKSFSETGRTNGPMVLMFDFKASPAAAKRSRVKDIPTCPSLSSSWETHL